MPSSKTLSLKEFAKLAGVKHQAIHYAIGKGKIPSAKKVDGCWRLDKNKSLKEWQESRDILAVKKGNKRKLKAEKAEVFKPKDFKGNTFADSELQEKFYKAQMAELKYMEQAGELVKAKEVERKAFELGRKVRDSILAIPVRLAHELAAETDPHTVEVMLTKELVSSLERLSKGKK